MSVCNIRVIPLLGVVDAREKLLAFPGVEVTVCVVEIILYQVEDAEVGSITYPNKKLNVPPESLPVATRPSIVDVEPNV